MVAHGPNELPARKKVRILEFILLCSPHLIHSQTIWAPDGEEVLVSGFVNIQLCSPARVHQLHILAKLVLDVAYCRGQLSTKDDRSGKGRVNAGRKNTQNTTQAMRADRTGAGFLESSLSPVEERLASQIVVDEGRHRSYLGTTKPHLRL